MRKFRGISAAVLLMAVTAMPLRGDLTYSSFSGTYTGGNDFATTAAITLSWQWLTDSAAGIAIFQLNITNQGIYGEVYKAIGLINIPSGLTVGAPSSFPNVTPSSLVWGANTSSDLGGSALPSGTWAWLAPNPAPHKGLQVGQTATFNFRVSGITSMSQIQQIGAGIHGISGPDGCSTKLGVLPNGTGGGRVTATGPYSACGTTTVTPEPTTVVLLGTGLLGLIGMARLRRREEFEFRDEDQG